MSRNQIAVLTASAAVVVGVLGGCGGGGSATSTSTSGPRVAAGLGAGLVLTRTSLTADENSQALAAATSLVDQLTTSHPELSGLQIEDVAPVFDEHSEAPIGALVHLDLPAVVASVEMELIRNKNDVGDPVPSRITNLHSLELIYIFSSGQIVHLGIEPQPTAAADPGTATQVEPLEGSDAADPDFEGAD